MSSFYLKNIEQCKLWVKYLTLLSLCFWVINCSTKSPEYVRKSAPFEVSENAININNSSAEELQKLPHIGAETAARIIEHRERFGDFRRPEHLLLISGISDQRFRKMRPMIKVN
jgi:competence ComEA-like helix-hairpin-helix protein